MDFVTWLRMMGCEAEITQEDDGSGYFCVEVITPTGLRAELTISNVGEVGM